MTSYMHIHEWEAERRHAEALRRCEKRQQWNLEGVITTRPRGLLYRLTHRRPAIAPAKPAPTAPTAPTLQRAS